jgi:hypothetical protein
MDSSCNAGRIKSGHPVRFGPLAAATPSYRGVRYSPRKLPRLSPTSASALGHNRTFHLSGPVDTRKTVQRQRRSRSIATGSFYRRGGGFLIRFGVTVALPRDLLRKNDNSVITNASTANAVAAYAICCGYLQISGLWVQTLNAQFGAAASATFAAALNDVKLAPANIAAITRKIIAIISTVGRFANRNYTARLAFRQPLFLKCPLHSA